MPDPSPRPDPTLSQAPDTGGSPADTHSPGGFPFLAPPQAPDELGRLGPYRVLGVLGQGGMGAVFRADDPALRRHVALKVMLPQHAANPAAKARFLREARAQAAVEHDHVITIFQVGEDRGVPFLAMPLLRGMALSDALKSGVRPPVSEAVRVAREMAEGLAAAHARGLIHRDIKPANVWLEGDRRRVKILDFGLARGADGGGDGADDPVTASGAIIGTPAYMSPEQANGFPLDARSDLFSLGTVLYELLAGRRPFQAPTTPGMLVAVAYENPPPPSAANPEVPPALDGVVGWLMAKDPAARSPGAHAVADALRAVEADLGRTAVIPAGRAEPDPFSGLEAVALDTAAGRPADGPGSGPRPARSRGGPPGLLLAAGLVGLLAVAGAGFLALKMMNKDGVATATPPADDPPVTRAKSTGRPATTGKTVPVPDPDRIAATYVLSVGGAVRVNDQPEEVTAAEKLPADPFRLTGVNLAGNPTVTDAGLAVLQALESVRALDLSKTGVTDGGLAAVKGWKALETLGLRDTGVGDAGLAHVAGLPALADLDLSGTKVTDAGLKSLAGHPRLTHLVLDGTGVTDAGLEPLRGLKTLTALGLRGTRVTGPGVAGLSGCKNLTLVTLHGTGATAETVEAVAKALPWCRIEWDGGAVVPKDTDPNPDVPGTFTNALGMKFVPVGKGTARLGGTNGQPHTKTVEIPQDFFLGKYEVTQGEWEAVTGLNPSDFKSGNPAVKDVSDVALKRFPVETVSWEDCQVFIERLNKREAGGGWVYRLPTEAEWEYACRNGPLSDALDARFDFYFGKPTNTLLPDLANFNNVLKRTCRVGSYEPNRLGLYDLHGNVNEWCDDAEKAADGASHRVLRGGVWGNVSGNCRAAVRFAHPPSVRNSNLGLRLARVPSAPAAVKPGVADPNPDVPGTFTNSIGMKFVPVGKGTARLGGTNGQPHTKSVEMPRDFFLGKYEVTQGEWEAVTGQNPSEFKSGNAAVKDIPDADRKQFPVEQVSWEDCQAFIERLNAREKEAGWVYRLPTQAEWEYACRNGPLADARDVRFDFYFGKPTNALLPDQANFNKVLNRTCRVGSYQPNRLGLYDLHGNINEWCDDTEGDADGASYRVRGGSWGGSGGGCQAAYRGRLTPSSRYNDLGFRLARVPSAPAGK